MAKKKKKNKNNNMSEIWTEEQEEEYFKALYGMEFIAGYTENGIPFGIFTEEDEENQIDLSEAEDLPFQ